MLPAVGWASQGGGNQVGAELGPPADPPLGEELSIEVLPIPPPLAASFSVNVVAQLLDEIADQGRLVVLLEKVSQFVAEIRQAQQRLPGGRGRADQVERRQA